eukprot:TRINITY_DN6915_c0_g1_i7.p4 TRINITY_DN6915_c0_g1~~TRINITY_DN6915_c0_g1_i7.p4  ORF type:complete len:122 (-),score=28.46 TRINITY_DN6915_c0_g1_i7:831-1196(-)
MNEVASMCSSKTTELGVLHINSPEYEAPYVELSKQNRFAVYIPRKAYPTPSLITYINEIVIPKNNKLLTSVYVKAVYLDKEIKTPINLVNITEKVLEEYALKGAGKPFAFYRTEARSQVIQ